MNLLEQYSKRLQVSEAFYSKNNNGRHLDSNRKTIIAKCLDNTSKFLSEAFQSANGTQRADMGAYKKFALDLITLSIPNLIAPELVIVKPMSSMSGYISYIEYKRGTAKGATAQGTTFNNPFKLGNVDVNYTSQKVVEAKTSPSDTTGFSGTLTWHPVVPGYVELICGSTSYRDGGDGKIYKGRVVDFTRTTDSFGNVTNYTVTTAGTNVGTIDYATGTYTVTDTVATSDSVSANYVYDNIVVPQNDLPTVTAEMKSIPLFAKARRIAIYYSQLAEFQFKNEYGADLNKNLSEQAIGQLNYEIDTEICDLLINNATVDSALAWSKTPGVGVNKQDHYSAFVEIIEIARQKIYDATKKFAPNYMLIASNILPVLTFIPGFQASNVGQMNGPYFAGTLNGLKVYVTPNITPGKFVIGCNGSDMMSSAAVYAPYMPVVPTQLLQYADGLTSQGWSTLYDLQLLNKDLLIAGTVTA